MPQDAFTLYHLCSELDLLFKNGKVNRIVQPNGDRVVFTVYTGLKTQKLIISVEPSCPRIGVTESEEDGPLTAPNFCMLLRKYLLSATLNFIGIVGFDRIVKIDFTTSAELCDAENVTLYVELMGRYSNIILTKNGKVLGGNRGINNFDNGIRPLIVGRNYEFPPSNGKLLPSDRALIELFDTDCSADFIFSHVQGLSKQTVEEILNGFDISAPDVGERLFDRINGFIYNGEISPCLVREKGVAKDFCARKYAVICGETEFFAKTYLAEQRFFEEKENNKRITEIRVKLLSVINGALKKAKKRLSNILLKEKDASSSEENKLKGELIVANIYKIKYGDRSCVLDNYYNGEKVEIALDERLSPSDNAEAYYKKYNKQKRTLTALAPQKADVQTEIEYLSGVLEETELAQSLDDLYAVKRELEHEKLIPIQNIKKRKNTETECREYEYNGFVIKVGRNNCENDRVTFGAKPNDIWLHVKDYHSAHAVIVSEGKTVSEDVIRFVSEIVAYYSKARDGGKTEVVYTLKKFVKKPSGAKAGFVTYTDFKSVSVIPDMHAENIKND